MIVIKVMLACALGWLLTAAGVGPFDQTGYFLGIIAIVSVMQTIESIK